MDDNHLGNNNDGDDRKHLALIGAGYSHLQAIRLLSHQSPTSFQTITLINTKPESVYRGSLPDFISRQSPDFDPIDLQDLCDRYNNSKNNSIQVRFILGRVVDIDFETRLIRYQGTNNDGDANNNSSESSISYDVLSIDIGSKSKSLNDVPGANLYTIPTRPVYNMIESLKRADKQLQAMADKFAQQKSGKYKSNTDDDKPRPIRVSVVGGGANGIELALACRNRWKTILKDHELWISLISKESMLLPEVPYARRKLTEILIKNDVYLHMKSAVTKVEKDRLILTNGDAPPVPFDHCLWATGAGCHSLPRVLEKHGLSVTNQGWIKTHSTLQSVSYPNVFACGDCASLPNPLPKSGVYGLQEGPVLAENLDRYVQGRHLVTYEPNTEDLQFLNLGDGTAMGFAFGLVLRGEWVFEVKQAMNRRHYWSLTGHDKPASASSTASSERTSHHDPYSYRLNSKVLKEVEGVSSHDAAVMLNEINIENYQEAWAILERMSVEKGYRTDVMKQFNKLSDSCGKRHHIEERVDHEERSSDQEQSRSNESNNEFSKKPDPSTDFPPLKFFSWLLKRSWKDNSIFNSTHT
mmetsp:Transcript_24862/g.59020  ORF Transcript_24862/g.59020 Transcript_24862/m.59020 type:complete len:581 (-) Transcript_24862:63-1805(-)